MNESKEANEAMEARLRRIEARSLALERRVRVLRGALASVGAIAVAALLLDDAVGQPAAAPLPGLGLVPSIGESAQPPVSALLRTRRLEIVGEDGSRFVVAIGATREGHGFVQTNSAEGRIATRVGSGEDGRGLVAAYDDRGHPLFRAAPASSEGSAGEVWVGNGHARAAVRLTASESGHGVIRVGNVEGFEVASLGGLESDAGELRLAGGSGRPLARLGIGDGGDSHFEMFNRAGYRSFDFTTDLARNAQFAVHDAEGRALMVWPVLPPVEDFGDLPPVPEHLRQEGSAETVPGAAGEE